MKKSLLCLKRHEILKSVLPDLLKRLIDYKPLQLALFLKWSLPFSDEVSWRRKGKWKKDERDHTLKGNEEGVRIFEPEAVNTLRYARAGWEMIEVFSRFSLRLHRTSWTSLVPLLNLKAHFHLLNCLSQWTTFVLFLPMLGFLWLQNVLCLAI